MFFSYLDESGNPEATGNTSHFVLLGLAIPAETWRAKDAAITALKSRHRLADYEVHTGFMARRFPEQDRIAGFATLTESQRRLAVAAARDNELIRVSALRNANALKSLKKTFLQTTAYVHMTHAERMQLLRDLADLVGTWTDSRLFAEAYDKTKGPKGKPVFEIAFEQVVTRFQSFLKNHERDNGLSSKNLGVLVQDNNETMAKRITALMRRFHAQGTVWRAIDRIIETPLFVDSSLTSMVQVADLCAYATRRFFENNETDLFDRIYPAFDRRGGYTVGIRHYTAGTHCTCRVCVDHGREPTTASRLTRGARSPQSAPSAAAMTTHAVAATPPAASTSAAPGPTQPAKP